MNPLRLDAFSRLWRLKSSSVCINYYYENTETQGGGVGEIESGLFSGLMERGVFTGVRLTVQHTLHHSVKKFTKYKSDAELFVCLLTDSRLRSRYDVRYIR